MRTNYAGVGKITKGVECFLFHEKHFLLPDRTFAIGGGIDHETLAELAKNQSTVAVAGYLHTGPSICMQGEGTIQVHAYFAWSATVDLATMLSSDDKAFVSAKKSLTDAGDQSVLAQTQTIRDTVAALRKSGAKCDLARVAALTHPPVFVRLLAMAARGGKLVGVSCITLYCIVPPCPIRVRIDYAPSPNLPYIDTMHVDVTLETGNISVLDDDAFGAVAGDGSRGGCGCGGGGALESARAVASSVSSLGMGEDLAAYRPTPDGPLPGPWPGPLPGPWPQPGPGPFPPIPRFPVEGSFNCQTMQATHGENGVWVYCLVWLPSMRCYARLVVDSAPGDVLVVRFVFECRGLPWPQDGGWRPFRQFVALQPGQRLPSKLSVAGANCVVDIASPA